MADGQGGNAQAESSSAHASKTTTNKLDSFLEKGETILAQVSASNKVQSATIQCLKESIVGLRADVVSLKRKTEDNEAGSYKKSRDAEEQSSEGNVDSDNADSDIDEFLNPPEPEQITDAPEGEFLQDLGSFFVEDNVVGEKIDEKLSKIVNKALRGNVDSEKLKLLQKKYKRPENVENLQIPKIDHFVWDQLKSNTKSNDFINQKCVGHLNQAMLPIITAMQHLNANPTPDISKVKQYMADSFKFLSYSVIETNTQRRESIKKEVFPKFKSLCKAEHPMSATNLFGENLGEELKKLDTSKVVKMTSKAKQSFNFKQDHFLSKRGGFKQTSPQYNYNRQNQNQYNYKGKGPATYGRNTYGGGKTSQKNGNNTFHPKKFGQSSQSGKK